MTHRSPVPAEAPRWREVPDEELARLRETIERLRGLAVGWQATAQGAPYGIALVKMLPDRP